MNNKKVKRLKRIYDSHPNVQAQMSFNKFKRAYKKDTAKGSVQIRIIEERTHGVAR